MVFGKSTLARQRGHHRGLQKLGQLHQFVRRLGVEHPLASMDDRLLSRQQDPRRVGDGTLEPPLDEKAMLALAFVPQSKT